MPRRNHVRVFTNAGQRALLAVRLPLRVQVARLGCCSLALLQKWRDGELVPNEEHAAELQRHFGIDSRAWQLAPDAGAPDAQQIAIDRFYDALRAHGTTPLNEAECRELVWPALAARQAGYLPTDPTLPH